MTIDKAVLISEGSAQALTRCVASLGLPRRALSLPLDSESAGGLSSFIELWGEVEALRRVASDWPFPARAWLVAEHVPVAYDRTWPSGEPSPGVRMISTVHRRDDMTPAEFEAYWRGPHSEVAKSYTIAVWNYSQNVVLECLSTAASESPAASGSDEDGFVGMHFRSAEEMRARWQDHPAEAEAGAKDAARFMAVDRSVSITAVETVWEESS